MFKVGMRMPDYEYRNGGNRVFYITDGKSATGKVYARTFTQVDDKPVCIDLELNVLEVISTKRDDFGLQGLLKVDTAYLVSWSEITTF